jgi:hypothetical protein
VKRIRTLELVFRKQESSFIGETQLSQLATQYNCAYGIQIYWPGTAGQTEKTGLPFYEWRNMPRRTPSRTVAQHASPGRFNTGGSFVAEWYSDYFSSECDVRHAFL